MNALDQKSVGYPSCNDAFQRGKDDALAGLKPTFIKTADSVAVNPEAALPHGADDVDYDVSLAYLAGYWGIGKVPTQEII